MVLGEMGLCVWRGKGGGGGWGGRVLGLGGGEKDDRLGKMGLGKGW